MKEIEFKDLLKAYRHRLMENQAEFGKRFGAVANTVSRWETGTYEPPLKVIEYILSEEHKRIKCPICKGTGNLNF